jgi:hypothetical protein
VGADTGHLPLVIRWYGQILDKLRGLASLRL